MFMFEEYDFIEIVIFSLFWIILIWLILAFTSPFWYNPIACMNKYSDSQYKFIWGCMVRYENWYIPEELYQKQFIQNIWIEVK